jgi:hypothetical protein
MDNQPSKEGEVPKLESLTDFVEKYQKTIAVIGVFIALAYFWKNIRPKESTPYISYLCLLITVPLLLEVWRGYNYEESSWNLIVFINLFFGIFTLTVYYLVVGYPDYLETILTGALFFIIYVSLMALQNKWFNFLKTRDYEGRIKQGEALKEAGIPLEKRNEIIADDNRKATKFYREIDIVSVVFLVITLLLSIIITGYIGDYLHATFDVILDRSPEIAPLNPTTSPSPFTK